MCDLERPFSPIHQYFYPSTTGFTRSNDGWRGLCIEPRGSLMQSKTAHVVPPEFISAS